MGLSLSVLVALILLLPGAAFVFAATRLHNPTAPSTGLEQQLSLSLAVALIAAICGHLFMLTILQVGAWAFPSWHRPNLMAVIQLLGGHTNPSAAGAPRALSEHPFCVGIYIVVVTFVMWTVGKRVNKRLERKEPADWYQLLKPDDVGFVVLTADFAFSGETVLFKGIVLEFRISKAGDLERVVLGIAARKSFALAGLPQPVQADSADTASEKGAEDSGRSLGYGWIEIPGEKVVLQMRDAKTVNLDYFWTQEVSDRDSDPEPAGAEEAV